MGERVMLHPGHVTMGAQPRAAEKLQKGVLKCHPKSSKTQRQEDGCPPRQHQSARDLVQTKGSQPLRHNLMPRVNMPPTSQSSPVLHTRAQRQNTGKLVSGWHP